MALALALTLLVLSHRGARADCSDNGVCEAKTDALLQVRARHYPEAGTHFNVKIKTKENGTDSDVYVTLGQEGVGENKTLLDHTLSDDFEASSVGAYEVDTSLMTPRYVCLTLDGDDEWTPDWVEVTNSNGFYANISGWKKLDKDATECKDAPLDSKYGTHFDVKIKTKSKGTDSDVYLILGQEGVGESKTLLDYTLSDDFQALSVGTYEVDTSLMKPRYVCLRLDGDDEWAPDWVEVTNSGGYYANLTGWNILKNGEECKDV